MRSFLLQAHLGFAAVLVGGAALTSSLAAARDARAEDTAEVNVVDAGARTSTPPVVQSDAGTPVRGWGLDLLASLWRHWEP